MAGKIQFTLNGEAQEFAGEVTGKGSLKLETDATSLCFRPGLPVQGQDHPHPFGSAGDQAFGGQQAEVLRQRVARPGQPRLGRGVRAAARDQQDRGGAAEPGVHQEGNQDQRRDHDQVLKRKTKIPNHKFEIQVSFEVPNSQCPQTKAISRLTSLCFGSFGYWYLEFIWDLVLGAWNLNLNKEELCRNNQNELSAGEETCPISGILRSATRSYLQS